MGSSNFKMFKNKDAYEQYCSLRKKKGDNMTVSELHTRTAEEILGISNQKDVVPVDIKSILQTLNISAVAFDFSPIEDKLPEQYKGLKILGAMASNNNKIAILYSDQNREDSHRVRFTIAHEIAHCCLHGYRHHIEFRIDGNIHEDEIAANTFAGELLIPEKSLRTIIKQLLIPTIAALADIFDVSVNVMKERIRHLGLESSVIDA